MSSIDWLINSLKYQVNPSRVNLCQEVRKSSSNLHFVYWFLKRGFLTQFYWIRIFFKSSSSLYGTITDGPGNLGSIQGRVIPKTLKMVPDNSLHNTLQYKVRIKGKVEQSWERSSTLSCSSDLKGSILIALNYGRQIYFFSYKYYYFESEWTWK